MEDRAVGVGHGDAALGEEVGGGAVLAFHVARAVARVQHHVHADAALLGADQGQGQAVHVGIGLAGLEGE